MYYVVQIIRVGVAILLGGIQAEYSRYFFAQRFA